MAGSDDIAHLRSSATDRMTQTDRIRNLLPAELAPHLREVRVRDGMLIIYTESAAWGARMRL